MSNQGARHEYEIMAPGRVEDGVRIQFDGTSMPKMHHRELFQLADGSMAHIEYRGPVQS
jgi:hypothetical protein